MMHFTYSDWFTQSWLSAKKERKSFFVESLDQCRRLEVREKARKFLFFVMSLRLSDHKVLHNIAP